MGIFRKEKQASLSELKARRRAERIHLEELTARKEAALALVVAADDTGQDGQAARASLKAVKAELEIVGARLEELEVKIKAAAEAAYDELLASLPALGAALKQERAEALARALAAAAEADFLMKSYFKTDGQVLSVRIKEPVPGFEFPEYLAAAVGQAKVAFRAKQGELAQANEKALSFHSREGDYGRLFREGREHYFKESRVKEMSIKEGD